MATTTQQPTVVNNLTEAKGKFETWMKETKGVTDIHYLSSTEKSALRPNGEPICVICWEFYVMGPYGVFTVYSDGSISE